MTHPDPAHQPRAFLEYLYHAAVARALPLHNTAASLPPPPRGRTVVIGAGKAGGSMAQAVEALWPADAPLQGLVVTRYGHIPPRPAGLKQRIEVVEAAHPVPDAAGLGLGGNESYPDLFQPYGGFPDGVKVQDSYVTLPELPGIGFEGKADLYSEMTRLAS